MLCAIGLSNDSFIEKRALPILTVLLCLVLNGCGGGGGSSNSSSATTYNITATVSGLHATGLVLLNNGSSSIPVSNGATSVGIATGVADGTAYAVTVQTQPTGQTCSVANGSGMVGSANVTNIAVSCVDDTYNITASISGLTASGLKLRNNGVGNISVASGVTSMPIATGVPSGTAYAVAVVAQPTGLSCSAANGSGTVGFADVTITVTCSAVTATYSVGGAVTGLMASGLVLRNNDGDDLTIPSSGGSFAFASRLPTGSPYAVAVWQQPTGQYCSPTSGPIGVIGTADVTNVAITCSTLSATYSVGGSISGLHASGLVLQALNDQDITVASGATAFATATPIPVNAVYAVSIKSQPTGQTCTIVNSVGYMTPTSPANVNNIHVDCVDNVYDPLVGTYRLSGGGITSAILPVMTFFPDGTFIFALRSDDSSCSANNGNGVEYGVYRWNQMTGAFAFVSVPVDTNGDCGVYDAGFVNTTPGQDTLTKSGTTLSFDSVENGQHTLYTLTPVPSVDGTLTGAWSNSAHLGFTVFDGTNAVLSATTGSVLIVGQGSIPPGIEHACYSINPGTSSAGSLNFDFSNTCMPSGFASPVDTNGPNNGLSFNSGTPTPFAVSGDFLTVNAAIRSVAQ